MYRQIIFTYNVFKNVNIHLFVNFLDPPLFRNSLLECWQKSEYPHSKIIASQTNVPLNSAKVVIFSVKNGVFLPFMGTCSWLAAAISKEAAELEVIVACCLEKKWF